MTQTVLSRIPGTRISVMPGLRPEPRPRDPHQCDARPETWAAPPGPTWVAVSVRIACVMPEPLLWNERQRQETLEACEPSGPEYTEHQKKIGDPASERCPLTSHCKMHLEMHSFTQAEAGVGIYCGWLELVFVFIVVWLCRPGSIHCSGLLLWVIVFVISLLLTIMEVVS